MNKIRVLLLLVFCFALSETPLFAEGPTCAGSTYTEPTCGGSCAQTYCQDVSFAQDGSLFQCCVSEMPKVIFFSFILLASLFYAFKKLNRKEMRGVPLRV